MRFASRILLVAAEWRHRATPVAEYPRTILPVDRSLPAVSAEYLSLYTYLERRYATIVVLTFEQMEALLGFSLPTPAYTDVGWWAGRAVSRHSCSAAWVAAG